MRALCLALALAVLLIHASNTFRKDPEARIAQPMREYMPQWMAKSMCSVVLRCVGEAGCQKSWALSTAKMM